MIQKDLAIEPALYVWITTAVPRGVDGARP